MSWQLWFSGWVVTKSFPGHKGIPGYRGGSMARGEVITTSVRLSGVFEDIRNENRAREDVSSWKAELSRTYGPKRKMASARLAEAEKRLTKAIESTTKRGSWKAPGFGGWVKVEQVRGMASSSRTYAHEEFGEIMVDLVGGLSPSSKLMKRGTKGSASVTYKGVSIDWSGVRAIKQSLEFLDEHFGITE